jgi:hypothetical protein
VWRLWDYFYKRPSCIPSLAFVKSPSMQLTEQPLSPTKTMTDLPTLDQAHFDELTQTVRGKVYRRGDNQYVIANVCSC